MRKKGGKGSHGERGKEGEREREEEEKGEGKEKERGQRREGRINQRPTNQQWSLGNVASPNHRNFAERMT